MKEINQQRLRYFYAVCICGKIREAADNLNTDQSVIGRQIRILEEEIGSQLFERLPRGVKPTKAAELLLEPQFGLRKRREGGKKSGEK